MPDPTPSELHLGPDVDRGADVAATYIVGCSVTFIVLLLRFWCRLRIEGLAIDDWCMLIAWVHAPSAFTLRHALTLSDTVCSAYRLDQPDGFGWWDAAFALLGRLQPPTARISSEVELDFTAIWHLLPGCREGCSLTAHRSSA
jgi:hypothetical protein